MASVEPGIAEQCAAADWLTPFGTTARYPGDFPEIRPGDEIKAIELAWKVKAAVSTRLT